MTVFDVNFRVGLQAEKTLMKLQLPYIPRVGEMVETGHGENGKSYRVIDVVYFYPYLKGSVSHIHVVLGLT